MPDLAATGPAVLGFTGSRRGLHDAQLAALEAHLRELRRHHPTATATHGGCVGADRVFHELVRDFWGAAATIHVRPASNVAPALVDDSDADALHEPAPARDRNTAIVAAASGGVLLACPWAPEHDRESQRSGTWMTVRIARRRPGFNGTLLVLPDGTVTADR